MKKRIVLLFLILSCFINIAYSQVSECHCKTDLIFLNEKIRKIPAYKQNKKSYENSYSKILEKADSASSLYDCQILLNTLLLSINDNHSKIYSINKGATEEIKQSPDKLSEFKKSKIYNTFPKPNINLDSLQTILQSKPLEDIEGIYSNKNNLTIGVFKTQKSENYQAIILKSGSDIWTRGEIIYTLIPFGNDYLLNIGGNTSSKRLIAYTERIANGYFYYMDFKKEERQKNYSFETLSEDTYHREELSDDITYLRVGSFSSWYPKLGDAEKFYKTLEANLNKSHLIIDIRNNGGGGNRNSNILYKLIKSYAKKNKVYVLMNHRTLSNAEQFAYKLSKLDNCQLFGQRTNGTLAYEVNDDIYNLPCNQLMAVLPSKKKSDYIKFESLGIKPDKELNMDSDWIIQLKSIIEKNH